jgi:hypothetical protein
MTSMASMLSMKNWMVESMTVAELISRLNLENQDAEVCIKDMDGDIVNVAEIEAKFQPEVKIPGQIYQIARYMIVLSEY